MEKRKMLKKPQTLGTVILEQVVRLLVRGSGGSKTKKT